MKMSPDIIQRIRCPVNGAPLVVRGDTLENSRDASIRYPVVDGIPILIDEERSLFSIADYVKHRNTTYNLNKSTARKICNRLLPRIGRNIAAKDNYSQLVRLLPRDARVLVVGGRIVGKGMETLYAQPSYQVIGSDVSYGPETCLISDAHNIPFADETFDCVVIQAVLEHVLDPYQCVADIHRVLKPSGIVYAETPFMQQVHGHQFDFTRFSHLGHRRLFRRFEEIESGVCCGPGMALAWSYMYFLRSFARSARMGQLLAAFAHFTSFFLKYFDYFLVNRPGGYDAASACYFMGRKTESTISDRELIRQFRGL